jgi:thiol-disulfide isomerase/thioredoxin
LSHYRQKETEQKGFFIKKENMKIFRLLYPFLYLLIAGTALQAQTSTAGGQQQAAVPSSANEVRPLKAGSSIPPIHLTTPEGASFDLNAFVKDQPVVLVFYRGGWCSYCNVHLKELMDVDPELRSLGYQILAVSPDEPQKLAESMEKHEMTYRGTNHLCQQCGWRPGFQAGNAG